MGNWGVGLYSGDFAQDLRSSVRAVSRLSFAPSKLLELLCQTELKAANDPSDPDHTVFWLVAADQFAKRGIDCSAVRDRALSIIEDGSDLATMAALGMDEKSLAKRRAMLEELRLRLAAPVLTAKRAAVLRAPQKLLFEVGDVLAYPVCKEDPINPYCVGPKWATRNRWVQDGWGAFAVAERGHVFEFLAWYRPLRIMVPLSYEPSLNDLLELRHWLLDNPGTLSARHYAAMRMKPVGRIAIDSEKLDHIFPKRMSPQSCAVSDISLANHLFVRNPLGVPEAYRVKHGLPPLPRIEVLGEIMNDAHLP